MKSLVVAALILLLPLHSPAAPRLRVSEDGHFILQADGQPFFYLGDTGWELFHRLTLEESKQYLATRARQGFTVIQAVALAEFDGLGTPNAEGQRPFEGLDPSKPNELYWKHVDAVITEAEKLGLTIGLLPTWGDKWNKKWGIGPEIFNAQNAEAYAEWIGRRYADRAIIWILGGDRPLENEAQKEIIRASARGVRKGDGGAHLITLHPTGGHGSAQDFHADAWLDFNMRQNGHQAEFTDRYDKTRQDYDRTPAKPVIDAEPLYEGHPLSFKPKELGYSTAADVRRALYWDLFGGACGHTYGHHSIWQFAGKEGFKGPGFPALNPWTRAIEDPGANQMQYGRRLIESRPILTRIPDDTVLVASPIPGVMPGSGTRHFCATRDRDGRYAMVYAPIGRAFSVHMDKLTGAKVKAWWYNPRDGSAAAIGEFENKGEREFMPPNPGELLDWVLVLDDAAQGFAVPGVIGNR